MNANDHPQCSEFTGNQGLIVSAFVGLTAGMTATMFYSMGAFIPALEAEFGWTRSSLSFAVTIMTIAVFAGGTIAGQLSDRFGAARVAASSLIGYGLLLVPLGLFLNSLVGLWVAYFVIALVGVASTPIVMIRPIAANFERSRGLAMGIALTGAGLSGFWVPQFVTWMIEVGGWRLAYMGLGVVACLAAPVVYFGFRVRDTDCQREIIESDGVSFATAIRTHQFWLLSAMALFMAAGVAGLVVHFVPMFRDLGADPYHAAAIASTLGLSSVVGRLIVGWLLDRLPDVVVTAAVLSLAASGAFILWLCGLQYAIIGVLLIGLAAGAEIDLIAYLCARLFGRRAYGMIYGWQYSIFALGYGLSPLLVGFLRDVTGSYDIALVASGALIACAGLLAFMVGQPVKGTAASVARQA